jgi:hypothetical protein
MIPEWRLIRFNRFVEDYRQSESCKQAMIREYDRKIQELYSNILNGFMYTFLSMFFAIIASKCEYTNMELFYIICMCSMFLWMLYNIYSIIKLCCRKKY